MKGADSSSTDRARVHPGDESLIRLLDGELPESEVVGVESHLALCHACSARYQSFAGISEEVDLLGTTLAASQAEGGRARLSERLAAAESGKMNRQSLGRTLRHFGLGMAAAALIAVCLLIFGREARVQPEVKQTVARAAAPTLEVDGESFVALPYSNEDLPLGSSHVVEMQVPVNSLASAGIVLQPVANGTGGADRTVLADVLLGLDGQPLGIHVLSVD